MVREKIERPVFDVLGAISDDSAKCERVEDMDEVTYFPTVYVSYNRASGIGGLARQRIIIVHGPPQKGKTTFVMGLCVSAYHHLHAVAMDDTERAAEKMWYASIIPFAKLEHSRNLDQMREKMFKRMDSLVAKKNAKKKADRLMQEAGCFEVVDTITKLMPKNIMEVIEKEGIDKMYPYQALWISTWMKEMTIKLVDTNSNLVLIVQERKNLDPMSKKGYTLPGGQAIQFDNCLRVRVTYTEQVKQGQQVVGVKSHYKVENNKIDGTTLEKGAFFTSNGKGDVPKGLDLVRECIEELKYRKYADQVPLKRGEKKKDAIQVKIPCPVQPFVFKMKGGFEDLRLRLMKDKDLFDGIVDRLNEEVRR